MLGTLERVDPKPLSWKSSRFEEGGWVWPQIRWRLEARCSMTFQIALWDLILSSIE